MSELDQSRRFECVMHFRMLWNTNGVELRHVGKMLLKPSWMLNQRCRANEKEIDVDDSVSILVALSVPLYG
jgi:hypothetical protein